MSLYTLLFWAINVLYTIAFLAILSANADINYERRLNYGPTTPVYWWNGVKSDLAGLALGFSFMHALLLWVF